MYYEVRLVFVIITGNVTGLYSETAQPGTSKRLCRIS